MREPEDCSEPPQAVTAVVAHNTVASAVRVIRIDPIRLWCLCVRCLVGRWSPVRVPFAGMPGSYRSLPARLCRTVQAPGRMEGSRTSGVSNKRSIPSRSMGFNNPRVSWSEIERRLSDRGPVTPAPATPAPATPAPATRAPVAPAPATQGSSTSPVPGPGRGAHRYAELHCHSAFSFLDGASTPEELAEEAAELGLEALAITDHPGFYGVVRFAEAARTLGLPSVFGAEVTLGAAEPRQGPADPDGRHLVILARDPTGYAKLASLLSQAQMAGEKGHPRLSFADVAEAASGRARGHWAVLTGGRKGTVPAALVEGGPAVAQRELRALVAAFGAEHTFVELWDHGDHWTPPVTMRWPGWLWQRDCNRS